MLESQVIYDSLLDLNKLINETCRDESEVAKILVASAKLFSSLYPTILQSLRKELDNAT